MSQRLFLWFLLLNKTQLFSCWDVVVVGSGFGGATIADEIAKYFPKWSILLLEAGPDAEKKRSDISIEPNIPVLSPTQNEDEYFNFKYTTEVQEGVCLAMIDKKCDYTYGKGTGGSSQIGSMIYARGFPNDFNLWADDGCVEWDYASLTTHFERIEKLTLTGTPPSPISPDDHGVAGSYVTEFPVDRTEFAKAFLASGISQELEHADYNAFARQPYLISYVQANTKEGQRQNVVTDIVKKTKGKIKVQPDAYVNKLNFKDGKLSAVQFTLKGKIYQAPATKYVILSAGVTKTPQILMLSGIGPKNSLSKLGIPLIKDLPVGQFMSDQIAFHALTYTINTKGKTIDYTKIAENLEEWQTTRGTFLAIPDGKEVVVFGRSPNSKLNPNLPDYQIIFTPTSYASDLGRFQRKNHRITDAFFEAVFGPLKYKDALSVSCIVLHPKSKGTLTLKDKKPLTPPVIDLNMLSEAEDANVLLACIRSAQSLFLSEPMKKYAPKLFPLKIPECSTLAADSDNYWKCCFKYLAMPMKEGVGTCKMGPLTDKTAVVDPKNNVIGVPKLKVVDGSVFRTTISSQSEATIMMMGSKVATDIAADINLG